MATRVCGYPFERRRISSYSRRLGGQLVEEQGCLRVKAGAGPSVLAIWPAGSALDRSQGQLAVVTPRGRFQVGADIRLEGGYFAPQGTTYPPSVRDAVRHCPGPMFIANNIGDSPNG